MYGIVDVTMPIYGNTLNIHFAECVCVCASSKYIRQCYQRIGDIDKIDQMTMKCDIHHCVCTKYTSRGYDVWSVFIMLEQNR